jgi:hypothetical protein
MKLDWYIWHLLSLLLLALLGGGCGEDFERKPPFSAVQDTVHLDANNWFYFNPNPSSADDVPVYPFSYRIFDNQFTGFLVSAGPRIYVLDQAANLDERYLLLDTRLTPGDTVHKFTAFRYLLLLDRRQDDLTGGEVFFLLRRTLIGMRSRRENAIWVLSPEAGIVAAADYRIDPSTGLLTFDQIVGEPSYFDAQGLVYKLKAIDHHTAMVVDRERNLIYKFDKQTGKLISRNFNERRDLYEIQLDPKRTRQLVDFHLQLEDNMVKLVAGDSCLSFTQQLKLTHQGPCQ